ncbi:beta clamp domain-containing protein [Schleiferilactobacillus harbinensis]|uniref:Uncharacterized protein n=1 Tax=Schleiferilactobacillus harbinensis TaxID=304207 RepID=A0A5P8M3L7_9LACO|nr:hypothetical protein [Schleiferilactobacillus harbinensis]QFR23086.1 hypothetical protein D1010_06515 [Schleiferilactobacillus harbinensis]
MTIAEMKKGALERAFKEAAGTSDARPILQNLHLNKDGSAVVTDTHVMLRVREYHNLGVEANLNLLQFMPELEEGVPQIGSAYPDTDRLFPAGPGDVTFGLLTLELRKALPIIKSMFYPAAGPDNSQVVRMQFRKDDRSEDYLQIGSDTSQVTMITRNALGVDQLEPTGINPRYLYNAFHLFVDYFGRAGGLVRVDWYGALRPITLSVDDGSISYLITPLRTV